MFNWLSLVTGFLYIVLGIVIILYKSFSFFSEPKVAYLFGGLLILYGIFRMVRAVIRIKNND